MVSVWGRVEMTQCFQGSDPKILVRFSAYLKELR